MLQKDRDEQIRMLPKLTRKDLLNYVMECESKLRRHLNVVYSEIRPILLEEACRTCGIYNAIEKIEKQAGFNLIGQWSFPSRDSPVGIYIKNSPVTKETERLERYIKERSLELQHMISTTASLSVNDAVLAISQFYDGIMKYINSLHQK